MKRRKERFRQENHYRFEKTDKNRDKLSNDTSRAIQKTAIQSQISYEVNNLPKKDDIEVTSTSRSNQLKTRIDDVKDRKYDSEKSGMTKITCMNCEKSFIGHPRRQITTRILQALEGSNSYD